MIDRSSRQAFARALVDIEAITFSPDDPFTWSSGLRAPVYCDLRLTLSYPDLRRRITEAFAEVVTNEVGEVDVVAGTATAGIPQAALLAEKLDKPMVYVRSRVKGHGRRKQIEGLLRQESRVVVIEDLISTGGSSLNAAKALRSEGAHVELVVAIFSYGLAVASENFGEAGLRAVTLTDFPALFEAASEQGKLSDEGIQQLNAWREDPHAWSEDVEARTVT